MKILAIILLLIGVLFAASQVWAQSQVEDIEEYPYQVVKKYKDFEIRQYEEANFIYATIGVQSYEQSSGKGFNILAGYIFGGNETGQKIAMTSPVVMDMDERITMKFLIPAQYDMEDMPVPKDVKVKFRTEQRKKVAAITFGGFANDKSIEENKDQLYTRLGQEGIEHSSEWSFLGYDPPFKLFDRRNEIVIELDP